MVKIREDQHSIYVVSDGVRYRPGHVKGYETHFEMDDGGLQAGDEVKLKSVTASDTIKVMLKDGDVRYWHNASWADERRTSIPLQIDHSPDFRSSAKLLLEACGGSSRIIEALGVTSSYGAVLQLKDPHCRCQLGKIPARSYEEAAKLAKQDVIPAAAKDLDPKEYDLIVVIGPESDMSSGRSVRMFEYESLKERRRR